MVQSDVSSKVRHFFAQYPAKKYKKGDLILQPEDVTGVFYLQKGYVREYGMSSLGIEVGLHIFMPFSYFPLTWVIADVPNRYYYEALTDAQIYKAPKNITLSFLKNNPDVLFDLTKRVFMGLDKLTSRLEYLSYAKAYKKVISILFYLARHFGEEKRGKIYIKHKFSHRDIGSFAGVSRETASREWEKLVHKEIIGYVDKYIVIFDAKKLKEEMMS